MQLSLQMASVEIINTSKKTINSKNKQKHRNRVLTVGKNINPPPNKNKNNFYRGERKLIFPTLPIWMIIKQPLLS